MARQGFLYSGVRMSFSWIYAQGTVYEVRLGLCRKGEAEQGEGRQGKVKGEEECGGVRSYGVDGWAG